MCAVHVKFTCKNLSAIVQKQWLGQIKYQRNCEQEHL